MFSKDYLVIRGRAFARSIDSASATLESPLSIAATHHRRTPLPCAMLPDVGIPAVGIFRPSRGSERLDC